MSKSSQETIIDLTAVIVAVTDNEPRILLVESEINRSIDETAKSQARQLSLPNGAFDPASDESLESGLRSLVEAQTGLDLYYVEQLYTFGNRNRDPRESDGGPRVISVAYIALTYEDTVDEANATWHDWYQLLPWEDWRAGCGCSVLIPCIGTISGSVISCRLPWKTSESSSRGTDRFSRQNR